MNKMIYEDGEWSIDLEAFDNQWARAHPKIRKKTPQLTVGMGKTKLIIKVTESFPLEDEYIKQLPRILTEEDLKYKEEVTDPYYAVDTLYTIFRFAPGTINKYYKFNTINNTYEKLTKETTMNDLFAIIDGDHKGKFVTKIGMNSAGDHVVEVRGTGEVFAVSGSALEKVMPYTINVRYIGPNTKLYSFFANKDDVAVGDVIIGDNYSSPMIVKAIDTKSAWATTWISGAVLKAAKVVQAPKDN